ncbi:MAG: ABC transporter ATP-binding protein, partial [Rhodanobacteraceae bacterium]
ARGGTTLLLVTHHVEEILPEVEQAVLLRSGRVFAAGTKRTTLSGANLSTVFGMPIQVTEVDGWYHASIADGSHTQG